MYLYEMPANYFNELFLFEKPVGKCLECLLFESTSYISHLCFIIHGCLATQHGHLRPSAPAHAQTSDFVGLGGSQIKAKQSDSPVARGALCF